MNVLGERVIDNFRGEYYFLSNFYPAPMFVDGMGIVDTVEHAFQASKTADLQEMNKVLNASTPAQAKQLGKTVTLVNDWDMIKVNIMSQLIRIKFFSNDILRDKLLATGDAALVEGNTWGDTYWGVCGGEGSNMLGIILMNIRDELFRS